MSRISTLLFAISFSLFFSQVTKAQCTNVAGGSGNNGTCALNATEDFEPAGSTYGFGPTPTWGNSSGYLEATPPSTNLLDLQTPTYLVNSNTVNVRFELTHSNVSTFDVYVITANNPLPILLCSGLTLSNLSANTQLACYQLNLSAYSGQRIRLQFTFHTTSNAKLFFDNFGITIPEAIGLPVNFINFQARGVGNGLQLTWNVANEDRLSSYQLEKSTDGRNYTTIGTITANGQSSYSFVDGNPASGTVYYRVKSIDIDGSYKYSSVLKLDKGRASIVLKVFPLPAISNITIQHATAAQGAKITIAAEDGRIVKSIAPGNASMQTNVDVSGLRAGMYLVRFDDGSGNIETLKFLKQ